MVLGTLYVPSSNLSTIVACQDAQLNAATPVAGLHQKQEDKTRQGSCCGSSDMASEVKVRYQAASNNSASSQNNSIVSKTPFGIPEQSKHSMNGLACQERLRCISAKV
jgi:hypothetical protein